MTASGAGAAASRSAAQPDGVTILVICNDSDYFLRHRRSIVEALVTKGHDVTVMTGGPPIAPEQVGHWRAINMRIERFSFNVVLDFALAWRTIREIVARPPDAIHLITLKPGVVCGLAAVTARIFVRKPRRILITIPGLGRLMSPGSQMRGRRAWASRVATKAAIRILSAMRGVHFTFETNSDRDTWLNLGLIRSDNSVVINGAGVDEQAFRPKAETVPHDSDLRVLFGSRLLYAKGLDAFVAAARMLSDQGITFIVAGIAEAGDRDSYAPDELANEKSISFVGEITDMPGLLRSVDVVCLPTRYGEGIPRILIEAAATGLPAISTDLDGCREIVKDGLTGVTIPVADSATMASAIAAAVTSYRDDPALCIRHGAAARALFLQGSFSEANVVGRFVALLTGPDRI